jgi:hypothetical protein
LSVTGCNDYGKLLMQGADPDVSVRAVFRPLLSTTLLLVTATLAPSSHAQTTPEQVAELRTSSLLKQLEHIAASRDMRPCEALARFGQFKPFEGALDPWGQRIVFGCENDTLRVQSPGPDGQLGTADDIVSGSRAVALGTPRAARTAAPTAASAQATAAASGGRRSNRGAGGVLLFLVAGLVAWVVVSDSQS